MSLIMVGADIRGEGGAARGAGGAKGEAPAWDIEIGFMEVGRLELFFVFLEVLLAFSAFARL